METPADAKARLLAAGLRPTAARLLLWEIMQGQGRALTAGDLLELMHRRRQVNKVTVYRNIEQFLRRGLVRRLCLEGRVAYYELASDQHPSHPHFQCTACGQVECLEPVNMSRFWTELKGPLGNRAEKIEILVEGICRHCRRLG